ncbi:MAG: hypothetical protein CMK92_04545 [Pseudomonas sp.]|nr:hypothetical protein [Pseudomonas sp.]
MTDTEDISKYKVPGKNALLKEPEITLQDCKDAIIAEKRKKAEILKIAKEIADTKTITSCSPGFVVSLEFIEHARYHNFKQSDIVYIRGDFGWDGESVYSTYRPDLESYIPKFKPKSNEGRNAENPFIMRIHDASVRFIVAYLNNSFRMNVDINHKRSDNSSTVEIINDLTFKPQPHRAIVTESLRIPSWEEWCDLFDKMNEDAPASVIAQKSPSKMYFDQYSDLFKRVNFDLCLVEFCTQAQLLLSSYFIVLINSFRSADLFQFACEFDPSCMDLDVYYKKYHLDCINRADGENDGENDDGGNGENGEDDDGA